MCTKFYQNRLGFVEDMTINFGVFFGSQCICRQNIRTSIPWYLRLSRVDNPYSCPLFFKRVILTRKVGQTVGERWQFTSRSVHMQDPKSLYTAVTISAIVVDRKFDFYTLTLVTWKSRCITVADCWKNDKFLFAYVVCCVKLWTFLLPLV